MINTVELHQKVLDVAKDTFKSGIDTLATERFVEEIKSLAEDTLEEYIFSVAEDKQVLSSSNERFLDFSDGYVAQMRAWQRANTPEVQRVALDVDRASEGLEKDEKELLRKHLLLAGVATIGSIALGCLWATLPALLAEAIALWVIYRNYTQASERMQAMRAKQLEFKLQNLQDKIINTVVADISSWLDSAEQESERIKQLFQK